MAKKQTELSKKQIELAKKQAELSKKQTELAREQAELTNEQTELTNEQTELNSEQTELIEKLNCLEFETSQLNRAYQLWRSYLEQGKAPDWMAAAIRIAYDALMTFCLDSARNLAQLEAAAREMPGVLGEESLTALPSPELLPITEPLWSLPPAASPPSQPDWPVPPAASSRSQQDWSMPLAASAPTSRNTIWEQPTVKQGRLEVESRAEISDIFEEEEESATAEPSPELWPVTEPDWSVPLATRDTIWEQPIVQEDQLVQEAAEISGIWGEESTALVPSSELWPVPRAISPASTGDAISEQFVIRQHQLVGEIGGEPAAIHFVTLPKWLHGPGMYFLAASIVLLIAGGGAVGIYLASAHAAPRAAILQVQNSTAQADGEAIAIPTDKKAEFKFDPDPVVARPGRSFVLNAVLSPVSDIASVAAQIDYDANLLQFMGASQGKFLLNHGQQVVLVQHDDPSTGVLRISAEQSPGNPGISGDGPVFALSFQAKRKGKATVSIVPGAHDSQGRRIETAGSQVSVTVN